MYKLILPDTPPVLTERPNYIKLHSNGCYVLCDETDAEGIAHNGTPYMFEDGAMVVETDGGTQLQDMANVINVMLGVE